MRRISVLAFPLLVSCGDAASSHPAAYCGVIAAHQNEELARLTALFDDYAAAHHLKSDKTDPGGPVYFNAGDTYEIQTRMPFGPQGSTVLLIARDSARTTTAVQELESFLKQSVAPRFAVTRCQDIPDFRTPVLYGWPNRDKGT